MKIGTMYVKTLPHFSSQVSSDSEVAIPPDPVVVESVLEKIAIIILVHFSETINVGILNLIFLVQGAAMKVRMGLRIARYRSNVITTVV